MNHLNSVLIEGVVIRDPEMGEKHERHVCTFKLISTRYATEGVARLRELSFFDIEVRGKSDIEKCKSLAAGHGVRVVGRMMTERFHDRGGIEHSALTIIAEHVEIKPKYDTNPGEVQ